MYRFHKSGLRTKVGKSAFAVVMYVKCQRLRFTSMHYILDTLYINVIIHNTTMCTHMHGFEFLIYISVWYSFYDEKFSITSTWIFKSTKEPWPTILFSSSLYSRRHKGNDWAYYLAFTVWLCIKTYLSIGIRKIKVLSVTIVFMYCTIPAALHVTYFREILVPSLRREWSQRIAGCRSVSSSEVQSICPSFHWPPNSAVSFLLNINHWSHYIPLDK